MLALATASSRSGTPTTRRCATSATRARSGSPRRRSASIVPDQRDVVTRLYARLFAGDTFARSIELTFRGKHGQPIPVEVSYGHARAGDGHALVLIWSRSRRDLAVPAVDTRGRSSVARRRARGRVRARDQQPVDVGAAQPSLAAQAARHEPRRCQASRGAARARRHHDRRRAHREQRARVPDARVAR